MKKIKKIEAACAVCALQYVSGIDEETVLRICAMHGFAAGEGMTDYEWKEAARDLGLTLKKTRDINLTLRQIRRKYKHGLYILSTHDHLFALDNGIIIDPRNPKPPGLGRIISGAWIVTK